MLPYYRLLLSYLHKIYLTYIFPSFWLILSKFLSQFFNFFRNTNYTIYSIPPAGKKTKTTYNNHYTDYQTYKPPFFQLSFSIYDENKLYFYLHLKEISIIMFALTNWFQLNTETANDIKYRTLPSGVFYRTSCSLNI